MNSKAKTTLVVFLSFLGGAAVFAVIFLLVLASQQEDAPIITVDTGSENEVEDDASTLQPEISVMVVESEEMPGFLQVAWGGQPVPLSVDEFGFSSDSNWLTAEELFTVYRVGQVLSEPYSGDDFLLIERRCEGPCGAVHYRVIDDRDSTGLVLLENYSNDVFQGDEDLFVEESEYQITDLEMPADFQLGNASNVYTFDEEPFSPAAMFNDYTTRSGHAHDTSLIHPIYGAIWQDLGEGLGEGSFIVRAPDHTVKLYRLEFPFAFEGTSYYGALIGATSVRLETPTGIVEGEYSPIAPTACPPRSFEIVEDGGDYSVPSLSPDSYFFKVGNIDQDLVDRFWGYNSIAEMEKDADDYNILLYKDDLDRWMLFRNLDIYLGAETECPYFNSAL